MSYKWKLSLLALMLHRASSPWLGSVGCSLGPFLQQYLPRVQLFITFTIMIVQSWLSGPLFFLQLQNIQYVQIHVTLAVTCTSYSPIPCR